MSCMPATRHRFLKLQIYNACVSSHFLRSAPFLHDVDFDLRRRAELLRRVRCGGGIVDRDALQPGVCTSRCSLTLSVGMAQPRKRHSVERRLAALLDRLCELSHVDERPDVPYADTWRGTR